MLTGIYIPYSFAQLELSTSTNKLGEATPTYGFNVGDTLSLNYNIKNLGREDVGAKLEVYVKFPDNNEHELTPSIVLALNNDSCCGDPKIRIGNSCEGGRYSMRFKNDYYCCKKPAKVQSPLPNCPITNNVVIPPNYPPNPTEWAGGLFKYTFRSDDGLPSGEYQIKTKLVEPNNENVIIKEHVASFNKKINLPTTTLSSCQEITQSGNYVLDRDIRATGNGCLHINNVDSITIDCKNHAIILDMENIQLTEQRKPLLGMENVKNFIITNCIMKIINPSQVPSTIIISNSNDGVISRNTFYDPTIISSGIDDFSILLDHTSNIKFSDNVVYSIYQQHYSNNNIIENNILSPTLKTLKQINDPIDLDHGRGNIIRNNKINGKWDGSAVYLQVGADDGIVLTDESDDLIEKNKIENNWDCGIETAGLITNTKIIGNNIKNSGVCGIGAWYYNSWKGNEVSGNIVDIAPVLLSLFRDRGLRPQDDYVYFKDNIFNGNRFINARQGLNARPESLYSSWIAMNNLETIPINPDITPGDRPITPNDVIVGNNIFTNNDFGVIKRAPFLIPGSMIVDGGGNICSEPTIANYPLKANYPLRCRQTSTNQPTIRT